MLMTREKRPAIRTLRGWAISMLQEAGAIRECEEHGWMQDRGDPHARERAFDIARQGSAGRVRRLHASVHRAERMLDCLAALAHRFRVCIEALLHGFEQMLVLPPCDPPLWHRRALGFERTSLTGCGPVTSQRLAVFLVRIAIR